MSTNEEKKDYIFEAICFSTNYENFSSISIIKQYLMSTKCSNIEYSNNNSKVTFNHTLIIGNNTQINCKNTYIEISPFSKNIKINDETDCFIIFFDLEYNDSLVEFNKILKMFSDVCDVEKKIYVIEICTNEDNIKNDIKVENIKNFFGRYILTNYEISTINMNSINEFSNKIDKITKEMLQEKSLITNDIKDYDNDKSKSLCCIF